MRAFLALVPALAGLLAGCNGSLVGDEPTAGADQPPASPTPSDAPPEGASEWRPGQLSGDPASAGRMPLRQLSRTEYLNAVARFFGEAAARSIEDSLPSDVAGTAGFATPGLASEVSVRALQSAAERLASSADIAALSGCTPAGQNDSACVEALLDGFGRRAFRRPLTPAERSNLLAAFNDLRGTSGLSYDEAMRAVLEAILQSPGFLYRWELGAQPADADERGVVKLTPYEIGARLAFFLWSAPPDDALLDLAATGGLDTPQQIGETARRLLAAPEATATMRNFHLQWLEVTLDGISKNPELYPSYEPALGHAMEQELALFAGALFQSGGTLPDLFTSRQGFVNQGLASIYGVAPVSSSQLEPITLPPERAGILTRAGFLSATANAYEGDPTKRGALIRRRVLCGTLAPPPANVPALPPPSPNASVRERHTVHMESPACKGCHVLTDPIGFGLSAYDAIGAYHTQEAGRPVDASGVIAQLDGSDVPFNDAGGLMAALAGSIDARACITKQWLRFAFSREETSADDYSLSQIYARFESSGFDLKELLVAMSESRSFAYRAVAEQEVVR